jgi:plasmid replication initiation protein
MSQNKYELSEMANDLVVKSNRLNMAIQNLTLPELRIIQLAIVDARETGNGLSTDTPLRIDAMRYAEAFETTRQNAYNRMKEAEETLFNRRFTFLDSEGKTVKSRWIQRVRYLDDEGAIELAFTLDVVKGITRLDGAEEFFTQYLLSQTSNLNSVYSVRLYELLIQWKTAVKTPVFELSLFRGKMGLNDGEYKAMNDFKKRVLDLAVNEINEKTDLTVSYTQEKKGRLIHGFKFTVKQKEKTKKEVKTDRDNNTLDMFYKMTDKQIDTFATKLANLPALSHKAPVGASMQEFISMIASDLRNEKKQSFYKPFLEQLGFKGS